LGVLLIKPGGPGGAGAATVAYASMLVHAAGNGPDSPDNPQNVLGAQAYLSISCQDFPSDVTTFAQLRQRIDEP
jgi:hypothetical protein